MSVIALGETGLVTAANKESTDLSGTLEIIFGGTFDPVHLGHLAIIDRLQQLFPHTLVRLLPCALPVLKSSAQVSFLQRVDMLQLALGNRQNWRIDPRENLREGPSYTVDTLSELVAESPETARLFVIGADSAIDLLRWHQWQKLSDLCHLLVVNRPGFEWLAVERAVEAVGFQPADSAQQLFEQPSGRYLCAEIPQHEQSSTKIRETIANQGKLDSMLAPSVIEYIRHNHLYK